MNILDSFKLDARVAIITGGAGMLGKKHAEAIASAGGLPILWDLNEAELDIQSLKISDQTGSKCYGMRVDITSLDEIENAIREILDRHDRIDILINNAANDPKVSTENGISMSRLENLPLPVWDNDIKVGLTGAFLCSRTAGTHMAQNSGGVILNIASDLGVIAPDQRIYRMSGFEENQQPVKPVTYSVVKHGLIGLTKYLATYWADKNVRVNSLSPGGIYCDQPKDFVMKLSNLIPMGRMATSDEYKAAVLFMVSDASSYMTGTNIVIDGGRTCW